MKPQSQSGRRGETKRKHSAIKMEGLEIRRLFTAGDSTILGKVEEFTQTSATAPTVPTSYEATADVNENVSGTAISSGLLTLPESSGVSPQPFTEEEDVSHWGSQAQFETLAGLDGTVPGGTYTINVVDGNGNHTYTMSLPGTDSFPSAPAAVVGFSALQTVNSSQALTVTWSPLEGGTSSDFVELNISGAGGTVFQTPNIGASGALNGTSTSVVVPAGTLQPGINYSASIIYGELAGPVDTTDYPGVNGYPVFATETDFSIQTLYNLAAPTGVAASQGTFPHHTTITWAAVSGAASYQVYRSTVDNFADANKLVGGVSGTAYSDTAAAPGVLHYYWVLARNGTDIGPESAAVSGFTELNAPAAFQSTDAVHHVALTWDTAVNAASYQIFRGITSDFSSATRIAAGITTTFFDDTTAVSGTDYFYWVRPKNALGVGAAAGPEEGALS